MLLACSCHALAVRNPQTDREIVLQAVKQDGRTLEHAATELRADREVILEAVKQDKALEGVGALPQRDVI